MYHYGGREASPTHTGDLPFLSSGAEEPRKTSLVHRNRVAMLEVALKSHEYLGTCQREHKKLSM